jgi:hypothetical protein
MMLAGLLVFVGGLALASRGYHVGAAVLLTLAVVLLILGRPLPSVADVVKKGRKS